MYYPVALKIDGKSVVVVGGGEVAEGKVQGLLDARARVTVVSPEATPRLRALAESNDIALIDRAYDSSDIAGAMFVIAATDDASVQDRVWRDAREKRVMVNSVDDPEHCDFIVPSILRRDDLIVAVSTSGKSPAFAAWLRRRLSEIVTSEFGRVVTLLGSMRAELQERFKTLEERRRAYQSIFATNIVTSIRDCDDDTAKARVQEIVKNL